MPEFVGMQIQTEEGKPLMAIPQRHGLGLEVNPLRMHVLAGEAGDAHIGIPQSLEKLRIPTARKNVPVRHEGRERRASFICHPNNAAPTRLTHWIGEAEKDVVYWGWQALLHSVFSRNHTLKKS